MILQRAFGHVRDPLYLNAYALMASNILTALLGVVYWALAARLVPVAAVGVASATISLVLFVSGVSQLNLRAALVRLVPEAGERTVPLVRAAYLATASSGAVLGIAVFGSLVLLGAEPLASLARGSVPGIVLVLLLSAATVAWNLFNVQDGVLIGLRRTLWVPLENGIFGFAKLLLLAVLASGATAAAVLVSWYLTVVVVVAVVTVVVFRRWLPGRVDGGEGSAASVGSAPEEASPLVVVRARLLRFVAGDFAASLFALAITALLPVLIAALRGTEEAAFLYLPWLVATTLDLLPINLSASLTVETASGRAGLAQETRRAVTHALRLLVPAAIVVALGAEWILAVFGPEYARSGTDLLRLLALSVVPYAAIAVGLAVSRVRGRPRELIAIQATLAALSLGGSALLLGPMGILGVGVAIVLARVIVGVAVFSARLWPLMVEAREG